MKAASSIINIPPCETVLPRKLSPLSAERNVTVLLLKNLMSNVLSFSFETRGVPPSSFWRSLNRDRFCALVGDTKKETELGLLIATYNNISYANANLCKNESPTPSRTILSKD